MAELNTGGGDKKGGGKVRSKKANPSVDLTAMVDLAFLLITFFILTTTLSKPQSMNLAMPDKDTEKTPPTETPAWRTLTIVLGSDDKVVWYHGKIDNPVDGPAVSTYGKNGVRALVLNKKKVVDDQNRAEGADLAKSAMTIIIKPSERSNYKNVVDILDEMAITGMKKYAIVDITPEDVKLLETNNIYNEVAK